ncbi:MAG: hypothetical protein ACFE9Z_07285 [Promethearchaeota archaeon]
MSKNVLDPIFRDGQVNIKHIFLDIINERLSLLAEIILASGFTGFCMCKFIRTIIDWEKLIKN